MSQFEYDVFLSHNSKDKEIVRNLAEKLRADGLTVWLDEWVIKLGDSIPSKVMLGLEKSRVLLMMLSHNFDDSDWAEYESGTFLFRDPKNKERRFIPVRLDDSPVREALRQFAYLDWRQKEEDAYQCLLDACRSALQQNEVSSQHESSQLETIEAGAEKNQLAPSSLGHSDWIRSVAVADEAGILVTACDDGVVRVWDLETGHCTATLEGHSYEVWCVAVTPDGGMVISGSALDPIKIWDLKSRKCTATLEGHTGGINSVVLAPDGKTLFAGSEDHCIRIWDLVTFKCTARLKGHSDEVTSIVLSPDGQTMISASDDKTLKVWDLNTLRSTTTLHGHNGAVSSVVLTPDGGSVISGSEDKTIKVWDLKSNQCTATFLGHKGAVSSVVLTHNGLNVVSGSEDTTLKVWDLATGKCKETLRGHSNYVLSVALTPDGRGAISGSADRTFKLWDLELGTCSVTSDGHVEHLSCIAFSSDASQCVTGSGDGMVKVWDLEMSCCTATLEGHSSAVWDVALTSDGSRCVSGSTDGTVRAWDLKTGRCTVILEGHSDYVFSVAITDDGMRAISGSMDKAVKVWDLETGCCIATFEGHSDYINSVVVTADGRWCASGSKDGRVSIWDLNTGFCTSILDGHTDSVHSLALTSDGCRCVSGSADGTVKVWDLTTDRCEVTLEGHSDKVLSVAFSLDGHRFVSGSADGTVRVWDLETGRCVRTLVGHTYPVWSVSFSPDGPFDLISVAGNSVVHRWNLDEIENQIDQEHSVRFTNAKVLLVGESRVGKTGLAMRLATGEWKASESTDGHWATRLSAEYHDEKWATRLKLTDEVTVDRIQREIWLWDFAGQSDYRLVHQLFMDQTSLVVLVFDPQCQRLFDTLGRWDHDIQLAARQAYAKLLVAARTDVGGLRVSHELLRVFIAERGFTEYLETSAKNNVGCDELIQAIGANIDWERIPVTASNQTYDQLKTEIIKLRDAGIVLVRLAELNQRISIELPDLAFTLSELTTVVGHLAAPGLVWNLDFGGFVLLQPEKINTYAAAVIRTLRDEANDLGFISEEQIKSGNLKYEGMDRLCETDEPVVLHAMYQTFIRRGLCIQQQTDQGNQLVFPAFFGAERPEDPDSPPLFVTYEFAGFLDDIYATLVVRLYHTKPFVKKSLWKDYAGFLTESQGRVALGLERGKEGKGTLLVYIDYDVPEDEKVVFSRYVHEHLAEKGREIQRTRHYVCQLCGRIFKDDEETRDALSEDGEAAKVSCTNRKCRSDIVLWDAVEKKFASQEFKERVRSLREFAQRQIDNQSREQILIGHAFSIAGEAGQIFRNVTYADYGIDGEIEFKDYDGNPCGKRVYLQLKSGDSYLRYRKRDKCEVFDIKESRWAEYWIQQEYPVMLVIRTSDERIRWFNATEYLQQKKAEGEWPVKQIIFEAEDFSPINLSNKRKELLGPPPERFKTEDS